MAADAAALLTARWLAVLGLGLLHAVWQGALIAAVTAIVLREMRSERAAARYAMAYAALVLLPFVSLVTMWRISAGSPWTFVVPAASAAWLAPWAGCAWMAGAAASSLRLAVGWVRVRRLCDGAAPVPPSWQAAVDALADRLGIARRVWLVETRLADVPGVVGWLSPLVLVPVGLLAALPPHQVQLILMHELAHVRRHDYLWNLLQTAIETLFFFHPAVWWLSRRIREEREHCCDDIVMEHCADAPGYAEALTSIERLRGRQSEEFALAATGGSLLARVQRLLERPPRSEHRAAAMIALLVLSVAALIVLAGVQVGSVPALDLASSSVWLGTALGVAVGVRHALEPDHLVAVTALVADDRRAVQVARLGFSWGLGHTLTLLAAGTSLALVRTSVPEIASTALEALVGVMLIALGGRALRSSHAMATSGPEVRHAHGCGVHIHATSAEHVHIGPLTVARRPLVVGMVHGLAGSGALAAMAMATLPTIELQILCMALFGIGSAAAMAALSGLAGVPLARLARQPAAFAWVSASAGVISMAAGAIWSWPLVWRWL